VNSDFSRDVNGACARLGYSFFLDFFTLEDGTNILFRNVGTELPLYAACYPRKAQKSRLKMFNNILPRILPFSG